MNTILQNAIPCDDPARIVAQHLDPEGGYTTYGDNWRFLQSGLVYQALRWDLYFHALDFPFELTREIVIRAQFLKITSNQNHSQSYTYPVHVAQKSDEGH